MSGRVVVAAVVTVAATASEPVAAPAFKTGDRWVFDQTIERDTQGFNQQRLDMKITRTGTETMIVGIKRDGSPAAYEDHLIGADWSLRRGIDGQHAATARPFSFPMKVGQTWTIDYTDPVVRGAQTSNHVRRTYG